MLLAAASLAACWLTSSLDELVGGDAGAPDASSVSSDSAADSATGPPDGEAIESGAVDAPADVAATNDAPAEAPTPIDAGCLTDAYVTSVLSDHPVAYYRLDEAAPATTAADSSGHGNTGTYANVTLGLTGAVKTDPADTAAGFNGSSSLVTVGTQLSFIHTAPFSVEAWIYPTLLNGEYRGVLSSESTSTSPRYGYLIYLDSPDASVLSGFERWGGASSNPTAALGTITTGAWFHLVGTFDSVQSPAMVYYVNGAVLASEAHPSVDIPQTDTFVIGALNGGAGTPSTFQGSIDEVAVYDHALDPKCVQAHYKLGTGP